MTAGTVAGLDAGGGAGHQRRPETAGEQRGNGADEFLLGRGEGGPGTVPEQREKAPGEVVGAQRRPQLVTEIIGALEELDLPRRMLRVAGGLDVGGGHAAGPANRGAEIPRLVGLVFPEGPFIVLLVGQTTPFDRAGDQLGRRIGRGEAGCGEGQCLHE